MTWKLGRRAPIDALLNDAGGGPWGDGGSGGSGGSVKAAPTAAAGVQDAVEAGGGGGAAVGVIRLKVHGDACAWSAGVFSPAPALDTSVCQ